MALKVDEMVISKNLGDVEMDSTRDASGCSTTISDQLGTFAEWQQEKSDQALWHYFDHCRPTGTGSYTAGLASLGRLCVSSYGQNSGVSYMNRLGASGTWTTFAHEVGHNLDAVHPFADDANLKGTFGGLMDYELPKDGVILNKGKKAERTGRK